MARSLETGEPFTEEVSFLRADGSRGLLLARGTVERDASGKPVRMAGTGQDVTAWVYVFNGYEGGLPTAWYLTEIAAAAEKAGAPADYVKGLRTRPTRTASA